MQAFFFLKKFMVLLLSDLSTWNSNIAASQTENLINKCFLSCTFRHLLLQGWGGLRQGQVKADLTLLLCGFLLQRRGVVKPFIQWWCQITHKSLHIQQEYCRNYMCTWNNKWQSISFIPSHHSKAKSFISSWNMYIIFVLGENNKLNFEIPLWFTKKYQYYLNSHRVWYAIQWFYVSKITIWSLELIRQF